MSITTEFRRTVDDARAVLSDPKPLHALAGAGDLVVERIRSTVAAQQAAFQSIRVEPSSVQSVVSSTVETVLGAIGELPDRTQEIVLGAAVRANHTYDDLAHRGAGVVRRMRRQKATQDLEVQVGNTVRAAKSATAARKPAAKKATTRTNTARKSTARKTTARKTTARKTTARKTTARTTTA